MIHGHSGRPVSINSIDPMGDPDGSSSTTPSIWRIVSKQHCKNLVTQSVMKYHYSSIYSLFLQQHETGKDTLGTCNRE